MTTRKMMDVGLMLLSAATILAVALAARRMLSAVDAASGPATHHVRDWRSYVGGHVLSLGDPGTDATIVEFGDFQCPFCARLARVLDTVVTRMPGGVRVYFREYPLKVHADAHAAALVAECAAEQRGFTGFYKLAYESGRPLADVLTNEPGLLPDSAAFRACMASSTPEGRVAEDSAAAVRLGVAGAPAVLAGAVLIDGVPSAALLERVLRKQSWR